MQLPQPSAQPLSSLLYQIETGVLKIPQFQRSFVWDRHRSARLVDSLLKGYPIGTFILWKTKEELRSIRNLGNATLPATPAGDYIQYVLDGQQRLTTLYATIKGLIVERDGRLDDFSKIYVDLDAEPTGDLVVTDIQEKQDQSYISVQELYSADFITLAAFPLKYQEKMKDYKNALGSYSFSVISVPEAPLDVATEIFTRINVTGQPLSVFEIMVAKTYSAERDFDLAERTTTLVAALSEKGYGTLPDTTILQAVSAIMVQACSRKDILNLNKDKFISAWPRAEDAIRAAVDYFRSSLRIPVSRLLPYNSLIVPFAYFFSLHPNKPAGDMRRFLIELFWRVSLGGYYSQSLESRLAQDLKHVDSILKQEQPDYEYAVDVSKDFLIKNGTFNTGRSFIKAILCVLASKKPQSFKDTSEVFISNDWLKRANSLNYHHFFPKAYLKKRGVSDTDANHIGNITLVDEYLNKGEIKDKQPSVYMTKFKHENPELEATMTTHFIGLDRFGIWEDNYELFLEQRCELLSKELKKKILNRKIDKLGQVPTPDDFEDVEIQERELLVEIAS